MGAVNFGRCVKKERLRGCASQMRRSLFLPPFLWIKGRGIKGDGAYIYDLLRVTQPGLTPPGSRRQGGHPLRPPFQRGYTPLDTPKRCEEQSPAGVICTLKGTALSGEAFLVCPTAGSVRKITKIIRGMGRTQIEIASVSLRFAQSPGSQ